MIVLFFIMGKDGLMGELFWVCVGVGELYCGDCDGLFFVEMVILMWYD